MAAKVVLLTLSVLMITKETVGEIDCESSPFTICQRPKVLNEIPRDVIEFRSHCLDITSYMRCAKNYQDKCGTRRITLFPSQELFDASFNTISEVCEEGTLLNTVAAENLKCLNDTFGKTNCRKEAVDFSEPLITRLNEDPEFERQHPLDMFCLGESHSTECVLSAISENCGKLVEEAALEFVIRSKSLEYACTVEGAKSVIKELDGLDLSEEKKRGVALLLEKIVEENRD